MVKLIVYDVDKTIWDHYNVSEFEPPFKKENNSIYDSKGRKLTLFPGVRETLIEVSKYNVFLGLATWNNEKPLYEILDMLGILRFFKYVVARPYPYKSYMLLEIIKELRKAGNNLKPEEIVYIDDRRIHFGKIWLELGPVKCIEMWKDFKDHFALKEFLVNLISKERNA
jgi:magnesium-dependent phosphatase-1